MKIDGRKLDLAKARACLTKKDMVKAGISPATLTRVYKAKVTPATAGKIAKALGVDVSEILED